MNGLIGQAVSQTIDSREVAEMVEMEHWQLLRKLEGSTSAKIVGIIPTLGDNGIVVTDYFIKSTYITEQNREMPCYLFTKMGCDFIANKFTGEKGILFTAKYVKRFNQMEKGIEANIFQKLSPELRGVFVLDEKLLVVENNVKQVKQELQDFKMDVPLFAVECDRITQAVRRKGVGCLGGKESIAYHDKPLRSKVYADIYREVKRQFGISSYKAIKRSQCDLAVDVVNNYEMPLVLKEEVENCNRQGCLV